MASSRSNVFRCVSPAELMRRRSWRTADLLKVFAALLLPSVVPLHRSDLFPSARPVAAFSVAPHPSAPMQRRFFTVQRRSIQSAATRKSTIEDRENDKETLMKICMAHFTAQALHAFCRLGIHRILQQSTGEYDDAKNNSFLSLKAITNKLQEQDDEQLREHTIAPAVNQDALLRTLRLLVADGILQEHPKQGFALTSAGALLQQDDSMVRHWMEAPLWNAWAALPDYLSNSKNDTTTTTTTSSCTPKSQLSPFEAANGVSSNEHYGRNKESLRHANNLVRYIANEEIGVCVDCIDWARLLKKNHNATTIADVGGHRGDVMRAVAARHPDARCICFDLASVVEAAEPVEGVEMVAGDLYEPSSFPSECDIIFMKHIVFCELDDKDSMRAFKSCFAALPEHGRLIIAEAALPDPGCALHDPLSLKMDAFMMLVGRDSAKTHRQWKESASEAGFRLISIQKTHIPTCSILQFVKQ